MADNTPKIYHGNWVDAQALHRKSPLTFEVPSTKELQNLKIGDSVKICDSGERFWITIISLKPLIGMIDNHLVSAKEYNFGSKVYLEKKHIYAIFQPDASLGTSKIVSNLS